MGVQFGPRSNMFLALLILSFFSWPTFGREIPETRSTETPLGYYCRQTIDYKICLRFPYLSSPVYEKPNACTCDNISIKDEDEFVGGPDCKSEDKKGYNYCFVDKETADFCDGLDDQYNYDTDHILDQNWVYD